MIIGYIKSLRLLYLPLLIILGGFLLVGCNSDTTTSVNSENLVRNDSWFKGGKEATVTIVEFSDFQCPACGSAEESNKKIIDTYGDKIKFVYRHFPWPQHQFGEKSAEAAEAAGEQGKFWEMHDLIFANQANLSDDIFKKFAQDLGLDTQKFEDALKSGKFKERVSRDRQDGESVKVEATPTYFINGEKSVGVLSFEKFKEKIDAQIK
ncbi:MAG: DsbA family protein [Patescibacteria group bacterium]|nr:DsbA family protein [Patescibacteria group bacterium]